MQDDVALVLQPDGTGKITFEKLTFNEAKTYNYVVYEDEVDGNGVKVDTTRYNVAIVVTDNGKGQLEAEVKVEGTTITGSTANAIVFENEYTTTNAEVTLEATKVLEGRELIDGEFKFDLYNADTDKVEQDDVALVLQPDGTGKITFEKLTFNEAKTYNYVVYEDELDENGVTSDTTEYKVQIIVTDNGKGNLVASVKVDDTDVVGSTADTIKFNNLYNTAGQIVINGEKKLEGRDLAAEEFAFELYDAKGNLVETVKNTADGNITFTAIDIDAAGEYIYTVKEFKGDDKDITYDESVYTVKATASDNGDGTLKIEYAYLDEANEGKDSIVFENKYTKPTPEPTPEPKPEPQPEPVPQPEPQPESVPAPESPKTGDATNPFLWFALMFISGGITFAAGRKLRRLSK